MEKLISKFLTLFLLTCLSPQLLAYSIESSGQAQTYEMQTCIQGQEVSGCHGIMLRDVVLKDFLGNTKTVDHLFFRNMRSEEGPVSKECLEAYVDKMNKYIQHPSVMKSFAQYPGRRWSDPEDGSQFSFPINFRHSKVDTNGSAYALPMLFKNPEFIFQDESKGLDCSFSLSMEDHAEDIALQTPDPIREEAEVENDEVAVILSANTDEDNLDSVAEDIYEEQTQVQCDPEVSLPLDDDVVTNIDELEEVASRVYETDVIMTGDLTYGSFNMNAATANVYLETYGDEIVSISLQGEFDVFGMSGSVAESVQAADLISGNEIGFSAGPGIQSILKVVPGDNFSKTEGGSLVFEFWDGSEYQTVNSQLRRDEHGEFKVYLESNNQTNEINYLSANIRGFSAEGMRVHKYDVSAR